MGYPYDKWRKYKQFSSYSNRTNNTITSQGCQVLSFHIDHPALGDLPVRKPVMFNDLLDYGGGHSHKVDLAFSLLPGNPTDPAAREL